MTMDRKYHLFIISVFLITLSCTEKGVVDPPDQQLKNSIIGTWKTVNEKYLPYSICFYPDGTFIDTNVYNAGSYNFSSEEDLSGMTIRKGKYTIANNILSFNDFYIEKYIKGSLNPRGYYSIDYEIVLENNTLERKPLYRLKPEGSVTGIYGSWRMDGWYCEYDSEQSKNKCEVYTEKYSFSKDSVKHNGYSTVFKYNPPYLTIGYEPLLKFDSLKVEFHNSIMLWYFYKWKLPKLIKSSN